MNRFIIRIIIAIIIIQSSLFLNACDDGEMVINLESTSGVESQTNQPTVTIVPEDTIDTVNTVNTVNTEVIVHVCGAVQKPGVYILKEKSRIVDAIEAAGGLRPEAAGDSLNQAIVVNDGQRIYVPTIDEVESMSKDMEPLVGASYDDISHEPVANNGCVNINSATIDELMTLPGIGEAKAKSIVEYRESSGGYTAIEDIMQVSGIKEGMFNKIKDKICVAY